MIYENASQDTRNFICSNCNAQGNFRSHGSYKRYLGTSEGVEVILISRVKCCSCNKTHSIIPSEVIPYKHYAISFAYDMLKAWIDGVSLNKIEKTFSIPRSTGKRYIKCGVLFLSLILKCSDKKESMRSKFKSVSMHRIFSLSIAYLSRKFCEHKRLFNLNNIDKNHSFAFT